MARPALLVVRPFVDSAVALGAGKRRILWHHVVPNVLGPVVVSAALSLGNTIMLESGLSYLGLGVQPPTPSWGGMIASGRDTLVNAPWVAVAPGIALVLVVLATALDRRRITSAWTRPRCCLISPPVPSLGIGARPPMRRKTPWPHSTWRWSRARDALEFDVRVTRDGEAVVLHDPTLERTTDAVGPIRLHTLKELEQVDAGFRFSPDGGRDYPWRGRA